MLKSASDFRSDLVRLARQNPNLVPHVRAVLASTTKQASPWESVEIGQVITKIFEIVAGGVARELNASSFNKEPIGEDYGPPVAGFGFVINDKDYGIQFQVLNTGVLRVHNYSPKLR